MQRRDLLHGAALLGAGASLSPLAVAGQPTRPPAGPGAPFKLPYAPHFGMFKNHAGGDLVDQLNFMAAEGFTALEDNGMMRKSVEDQNRIAQNMQRLGMRSMCS